MLTLEQTNQQATRFFSYLRNKKNDWLKQYFCGADSLLMERDTATYIVNFGFDSSSKAGVFIENDRYGALSSTKESLEFVLNNAEPSIVANLFPVLFKNMLTMGDYSYARTLLQSSAAKSVSLDVEKTFFTLVSDQTQQLSDLDIEEEGEGFTQLIISQWKDILTVLREAGLPSGLDIGSLLVGFVPESEVDESFYLELLNLFVSEGFSLAGGLPATDNPYFKSIALHDKLIGEMVGKNPSSKRKSGDGKM